MKFLIMACMLAVVAAKAAADESVPLLYSRANIAVVRKNPPPPAAASLPWQGPVAVNPSMILDVEVRDAVILYRQEGWFTMSGPAEKSGILFLFNAPGISPVGRMEQYAPLDILMIDKEGKIIQIAPDIVLAGLKEDLLPPSPVRAFLFLKGGACQAFSIHPGDVVDYKLFSKPPAVLTAPAPVTPAPAQLAAP